MPDSFVRAIRSVHIERTMYVAYTLVLFLSVLDILLPPVWATRPGAYAALAIVIGLITALGALLALCTLSGGWWRIERLGLAMMLLGFSLQIPLAVLLSSANQLWFSAAAGSIGLCIFRLAVIWAHDFAPRPAAVKRE